MTTGHAKSFLQGRSVASRRGDKCSRMDLKVTLRACSVAIFWDAHGGCVSRGWGTVGVGTGSGAKGTSQVVVTRRGASRGIVMVISADTAT